MSELPPDPAEGVSLLAVEHALGLLDADGRAEAERRIASDPAFAAEVETWATRFAPLLDDVAAVEPSAGLWPRIAARLPAADNVVSLASRRPVDAEAARLRRRLSFWRTIALAGTAASLVLALLLGQARLAPPVAPPPPPAPAAVSVATLKPQTGEALYLAAYDPLRQSVLVALPRGVATANRSPELWLIGADGKPVAIGVVRSGGVITVTIPAALARQLQQGVTLALSIEPLGGSPTGQPTGPVVATGALHPA